MPAINAILSDKLFRLIGTPQSPVIIDVREDEAFSRDATLIPSAIHRDGRDLMTWAAALEGRDVVVTCAHGGALERFPLILDHSRNW